MKFYDSLYCCEYCGRCDTLCSVITSIKAARARDICRKIHNGVTVLEESTDYSIDRYWEL